MSCRLSSTKPPRDPPAPAPAPCCEPVAAVPPPSCNASGFVALYSATAASLFCRFPFGRAGALVGYGALTQKSASTVLRQAFGAYHSRKKCLVCEILFDRSQCLLAGQKYRAHPRRGIVRRDEARLLELHFQNCVSLIKLRRPREVTQRQKKAG